MVLKMLRSHHKDILDLQWSPDGTFLISGSVDKAPIFRHWMLMPITFKEFHGILYGNMLLLLVRTELAEFTLINLKKPKEVGKSIMSANKLFPRKYIHYLIILRQQIIIFSMMRRCHPFSKDQHGLLMGRFLLFLQAIMAGLHYAPITDIAWSPDARYLALFSQDGHCALVEFQKKEGERESAEDGRKKRGEER